MNITAVKIKCNKLIICVEFVLDIIYDTIDYEFYEFTIYE